MNVRTITFKHEGEQGGVPIGPVRIIDVTAMEADPLVTPLGIPYGYEPPWLEDRGWMTLSGALALASTEGLELKEA